MLNNNLKGKRLLLVGGFKNMSDLVLLAHRNHVFLGVADYYKDSRMKRLADASYDIDAMDVDALERLYHDEKYDGIISNFNDALLPPMAELADRVGAYVPYHKEQYSMSTNKKYFKHACMDYGVPVPKEYEIRNVEAISQVEIEYPVIVKPVDQGGSKGIKICYTPQELAEAYEQAKTISLSGDAIVEQYIEYDDEITLFYIAQNGNIQLAATADRHMNTQQEGVLRVPDLYTFPSRYTSVILNRYNNDIVHMLKKIGVRNGPIFFQCCMKDNQLYIYEAGMRLNACKAYQILEFENKYNTLERLISYALTDSMGEYQEFNPYFKRHYATWPVVAKAGGFIDKIYGMEELNSYPWLLHIALTYFCGDSVPAGSEGTLRQLQARIHITGDTKDELLNHLDKLYELYRVVDAAGESILLPPHDLDDIRKHLNYDLKGNDA